MMMMMTMVMMKELFWTIRMGLFDATFIIFLFLCVFYSQCLNIVAFLIIMRFDTMHLIDNMKEFWLQINQTQQDMNVVNTEQVKIDCFFFCFLFQKISIVKKKT